MPYAINYDPGRRIIETKFQGELSLDLVKRFFDEMLPIAKEKGCFLILDDFREVKVALSIDEIYELPRFISQALASVGLEPHQFKPALVFSKDLREFDFFETVSANQGQSVKLFQDIDEARKWLSATAAPPCGT